MDTEERVDSELEQKMQLLQSEIIDKNLDKESFVNFCLRKKDNGDDLNNWTLEELKVLVSEFANSKNAKPVEEKKEEEEIKKENVEKMELNVRIIILFF
ncbi:MAG: hypothetical protein MJ252_26590 [archaeon]|nr:hypothetical protein [archaeon]